MSRSGYSDDLDQWDLIRWRGAVASAVRGKRGQAFLKEMESALLALPKKRLISSSFASGGEVCAIGSVVLSRKLAGGVDRQTALKEIEAEWPEEIEECGEVASSKLNLAGALANEIMWINDDDYSETTPEKRYEAVLVWVREGIKKAQKAGEKK